MTQAQNKLFNFLRKENLEEHEPKMVKQKVTVEILLILTEKEIDKLAKLIDLPFGHQILLTRLIEQEKLSLAPHNEIPINSPLSQTSLNLSSTSSQRSTANTCISKCFHDSIFECVPVGKIFYSNIYLTLQDRSFKMRMSFITMFLSLQTHREPNLNPSSCTTLTNTTSYVFTIRRTHQLEPNVKHIYMHGNFFSLDFV